ncbi:nitrite reductase, copper-containing [Litoribacter ruber]|uniref:copper-containing nitrite reductase n=1 Tax=Litoribacter ruber TaxID=702568 RepID=UPI001BD950FB|nr:copper-containing nitrite reductase [Litoribacter ruber]MBT0810375.1 nitrite reductase, copper-containing [Litoribacter ruber]
MKKANPKSKKRLIYLFILLISSYTLGCELKGGTNTELKRSHKKSATAPADMKVYGTMEAELTAPPFVPAPVGNRAPMKLIVDLEVTEEEGEMADGVSYVYWTFGGSVPGSFIRGRVGDEVEFTLKNHPDNKLPHNIDLHAVTGQGGGAEATYVAPGQQKTFNFKMLNPGLYVYHCATAPVGMHIANGMYGLILVEPEGGLPPVDKEYYVMQGDFYTEGKHGEPGLQQFDLQKAVDEKPEYVVFNGKVGGLTGENAISANVGETVRLFVGNGGPNLVSSFHVIGEIFDKVYLEGGDRINENVQTTIIPAGGSAIVEFQVDVPSDLVLVDHSIFRAFNKGAIGILSVSGEENHKLFKSQVREGIYNPNESLVKKMPNEKALAEVAALSKDDRVAKGKTLYNQSCFACHQSNGEGMAGAFPPLAKADYLNNKDKAIDAVIHGLSGEITVNGKKYNGVMPPQTLSDEDAANVLTFIYNSWGNDGSEITPEMIKKRR